MPRQAKRNSAQPSPLLDGVDNKMGVADTNALYNDAYNVESYGVGIVADRESLYNIGTNLDSLIDQARKSMESAAKSLDFMAAARYRDRMYELQQIKEEQLKSF
jgi:excinuclease ABC subunit B